MSLLTTYNILLKLSTIIVLISNVYCFKSSKSVTKSKIDKPRFWPVDEKWQYVWCENLKLPLIKVCVEKVSTLYRNVPKNPVEIPGDGNCFFSALSYWITGSSDYGQVLRDKIVDFMTVSKNFKIMTKEDERLSRIEKMYNSKEFAESPEVATAAEYLDTSIYVYSSDPLPGWHFISKNGVISKDEGEKCIYLINHEYHYDVVIDVDPSLEAHQPEDIQDIEHKKNLLQRIINYSSKHFDSKSNEKKEFSSESSRKSNEKKKSSSESSRKSNEKKESSSESSRKSKKNKECSSECTCKTHDITNPDYDISNVYSDEVNKLFTVIEEFFNPNISQLELVEIIYKGKYTKYIYDTYI
ncbi:uncharacterized protein LOC126895277 isoform X4 [Daktulosphaira vitifoliae]|uniref:uncharacterized protein LOC126895277 isoform X4 n=1 Tax=Daktulosphaira vitifoliae TaxID=58002 RepID=UPI0021AAA052|nr:uncharacterized protein LOC126895277 isoform X4 [Daktulosphaira vitifoliae]